MLHELEKGVYDVAYHHYTISEDDPLILIRDGEAVVQSTEPLRFPLYRDLAPYLSGQGNAPSFRYLFSIGETRYFTSFDADTSAVPDAYLRIPTQAIRSYRPIEDAFAGSVAVQLIGWYERSAFCGRCGHKTVHSEKERMMFCPNCKNMIYPQICPGVIVGVFCEGKILVSHYNPNHLMVNNGKTFKPTKKETLVAGYIETGETAEQAVIREVREEVGLSVRNVRYFCSAPWPFTSTLLLAYLCEVDGEATVKVEQEELSDAVFKTPEELDDHTGEISLTAKVINDFKSGRITGPLSL